MRRLHNWGSRPAWAAAATYAVGHLLAGLWCAAPLTLVVTQIVEHLEHGDAVLFEPGGMLLIEAIRVNSTAIAAALRLSALQFLIAAVVLLLPLAAVTVALNQPTLKLRLLPLHTTQHLPAFVLLGGLSVVIHLLVTLIMTWLGATLLSLLSSGLGEQAADLLLGAALLGVLLVNGVVGMLIDFARNAVVAGSCGAVRALPLAVECLLRSPFAHTGRWVLLTMLKWAGPLAAAVLASQFDLSRPGQLKVAAMGLLHQAAVLWLLAGHLAWLSYAARAVRRLPGLLNLEQLTGTAERNVEPDVPNQDPGA